MSKQTLLKTISWNVIATLSIVIGLRLYTGDWSLTGIMLFFSFIYFPIVYYLHEKVWSRKSKE